MVLSAAKGHFGVKKVDALSKNLEKVPILCFAKIDDIS
jgi:hypothetical protein